jgi:hypothetical protein
MKSKKSKMGRKVALNPKDVVLNFCVNQKTAKQVDEFVKVSGFNTKSEFLRNFVTAAVSGDEHEITKFFQVIFERATKQMMLKSLTGKMLKR